MLLPQIPPMTKPQPLRLLQYDAISAIDCYSLVMPALESPDQWRNAMPVCTTDRIAESFRRAIAGAIDEIGTPGGPSSDNVHETRRCLKRARAALRLMRPSVGEASFADEDARLAACARSFAAVREWDVLLATLSRLGRRVAPASTADGLAPLAQLIRERRETASPARAALAESARTLRGSGDTLEPRSRNRTKISSLEKGLRAIYRRGRNAHARATATPSAPLLHRWRKHAKYFADAVDALGDAATKRQGRRARLARRIGDWLGEHHDLAMLDRLVREHADLISTRARRTLFTLLAARQRKLRRRALRAGRHLYSAKPGRIAALVHTGVTLSA